MIERHGDAKQGGFGESWFIGALIIISTRYKFSLFKKLYFNLFIHNFLYIFRGDLLDKLIVEDTHFDKGFVTF